MKNFEKFFKILPNIFRPIPKTELFTTLLRLPTKTTKKKQVYNIVSPTNSPQLPRGQIKNNTLPHNSYFQKHFEASTSTFSIFRSSSTPPLHSLQTSITLPFGSLEMLIPVVSRPWGVPLVA